MAANPIRPGSIGFRLIVGASLWLVVVLAVTFVVLTGLFRDTVTRNFDLVLVDHVDEILSLLDIRNDGSVALRRHPVDPRFVKPGSGWYWTISADDGWREHSRSLGAGALPPAETIPRSGGDIHPYRAIDPAGQAIRVIGKRLRPDGAGRELTVMLSGPTVVIEAAVGEFNGALMLGLAAIGLGLVLAVVVQVIFGLKPLRAIGRSLAAVRAGRATRLEGGFPEEVAPLAAELNALLEHNERSLARTRTRVDDLAHALKTPIAALKNAAETVGGGDGETIRTQVAAMADSVEHHLARARIAGTGGVIGARTPVRPLVDGLHRTVARIYADKNLEIDIDVAGEPIFRGEYQDLAEMLGNLMDNACKWGRRRIRLSGRAAGRELLIEVDDDGPGIPEEDRVGALDRGRRLDETTPGSGLGLPIVRDIAALYDGALELARSPSGAVAARLRLPAA